MEVPDKHAHVLQDLSTPAFAPCTVVTFFCVCGFGVYALFGVYAHYLSGLCMRRFGGCMHPFKVFVCVHEAVCVLF